MCHLSSFCAKFGMTSCSYPDRLGRTPKCPLYRRPEPGPAGATTVEMPSARFFMPRYTKGR